MTPIRSTSLHAVDWIEKWERSHIEQVLTSIPIIELMMLPILRSAQPLMRYSKAGPAQGIDPAYRLQFKIWREHAIWWKLIVIALSALEPIYYPQVVRRVRYHGDERERCTRWNRRFGVGGLLRWLNVDSDWLTSTASTLLDLADRSDPMGAWSEVIRESDPTGWEKLGGEARSAVDLRIGAEVLLRYYERLARGRLAPKLKAPPPRTRGPLANRLKPQGELDHTLGKFGISPHPRLVLVVEGHTELFVLPLLMDHFGIRRDRDFIAIENAQGVGSDISLLIAFAVAPQTKEDESGRYLRLLKPPTRLLAIMDPEGKYATPESREKRRQVWIDRILETLPIEHRTQAVRESVGHLVSVRTWDTKGQSFEFANFTDRQIAKAAEAIDPRNPSPMTLKKRVEVTKNLRDRKGNLSPLLGGASKVDLARALWPDLLKKLKLAEKRNTEDRISAVNVIDEALRVAHEFPRQNLVIPLERTQQS